MTNNEVPPSTWWLTLLKELVIRIVVHWPRWQLCSLQVFNKTTFCTSDTSQDPLFPTHPQNIWWGGSLGPKKMEVTNLQVSKLKIFVVNSCDHCNSLGSTTLAISFRKFVNKRMLLTFFYYSIKNTIWKLEKNILHLDNAWTLNSNAVNPLVNGLVDCYFAINIIVNYKITVDTAINYKRKRIKDSKQILNC